MTYSASAGCGIGSILNQYNSCLFTLLPINNYNASLQLLYTGLGPGIGLKITASQIIIPFATFNMLPPDYGNSTVSVSQSGSTYYSIEAMFKNF